MDPSLESVVTDRLRERGVLHKIQGQIRQEVLAALKEERDHPDFAAARPDFSSGDNFVVNELIREYLTWNGLHQTAAALSLESGHPQQNLDRQSLEDNLGVRSGANAAKVPLLYSVVAAVRNKKKN